MRSTATPARSASAIALSRNAAALGSSRTSTVARNIGVAGSAKSSSVSIESGIHTAMEPLRPTHPRMSSAKRNPLSFSVRSSNSCSAVSRSGISSIIPCCCRGSANARMKRSTRSRSRIWRKSIVTTMSASAGTASAAAYGEPMKARHASTAAMATITMAAIAAPTNRLPRRAAAPLAPITMGFPLGSSGRTRTSEDSSVIGSYLPRSSPWPQASDRRYRLGSLGA